MTGMDCYFIVARQMYSDNSHRIIEWNRITCRPGKDPPGALSPTPGPAQGPEESHHGPNSIVQILH